MGFRFRALALHLMASATILTIVLGGFYFGWYRWPGWYLADALAVVAALIGVDLALGPLLTFIVANASKPRRELARDIAIIVLAQLCALAYGIFALWHGRPLYYAYSEGFLQLVQAYDIDTQEWTLAGERNPQFAPHWYSLPHWVWAPLPQDPNERERILNSAISGGADVISMPRYFKPWSQGLPELRERLSKVDDIKYFSRTDKQVLKARVQAAGLPTDTPDALPFTGRGRPLLAVFDPVSLKLAAIVKAK